MVLRMSDAKTRKTSRQAEHRVERLAEGIELYLGDCRDILETLPKVDALITDPPYGVKFTGKVTKHKIRHDGYAAEIGDDDHFIKTVVLPALFLSLANADRAAVFPGIRQLWNYPKPAEIGSFFQRAAGGLGRWGFNTTHPILYYGKDPYLARGLGSRPNSWLATLDAELASVDHPCPKPLAWMLKVVERVSFEGETVLDPFLGSGTTGVACVRLERKFIGIEIESKYFDIARRRIDQELRKPSFFTSKPKRIARPAFFASRKRAV